MVSSTGHQDRTVRGITAATTNSQLSGLQLTTTVSGTHDYLVQNSQRTVGFTPGPHSLTIEMSYRSISVVVG